MRICVVALGIVVLVAAVGRAADGLGIAVMEFTSKGGVTQKQVDALGDLLTNQIQALCRCQVIGQSDIRSALQLEQQKMLLGCSEDSCMAEIGGALGVPWLCVGNVAKFGDDYLVNLRMIDVKAVKLAASASIQVQGGQAQLLKALSQASRDLLVKAKPKIWPTGDGPDLHAEGGLRVAGEKPFDYSTWGHTTFWAGLGVAAFGGIAFWQAEAAKDDWTYDGSSAAASRHRTWNGVSYAAFGVGSALMVTGAVMWILDPGDPSTGVDVVGVSPAADGEGLTISVGGRW